MLNNRTEWVCSEEWRSMRKIKWEKGRQKPAFFPRCALFFSPYYCERHTFSWWIYYQFYSFQFHCHDISFESASQSVTQSVNVMVHNTFHVQSIRCTMKDCECVRIHKVSIPLLDKVAIVKMNVWYEKWVWNLCHLHTFPCSSVLTTPRPRSPLQLYIKSTMLHCVHVSPIPQIMWWYFASCLLNNQNLLRVSRTLVTMLQIKSVWNEERARRAFIHIANTHRKLEGNVNQRIWRACVCIAVRKPNKIRKWNDQIKRFVWRIKKMFLQSNTNSQNKPNYNFSVYTDTLQASMWYAHKRASSLKFIFLPFCTPPLSHRRRQDFWEKFNATFFDEIHSYGK